MIAVLIRREGKKRYSYSIDGKSYGTNETPMGAMLRLWNIGCLKPDVPFTVQYEPGSE